MSNGLLSTAEVATRLEVDDSTVRLWCRQGRFPTAQQVGRDWVIPENDLKDFSPPKMGRPPKQPEETTRQLNQAFRNATESEKKVGKKRGRK